MTILELYLYVAKSYPSITPSEFDGEVWQISLGGYDVDLVKEAAIFWRMNSANSHFMPTAQNLLEIINPSKKPLTADNAWAIAITANDENNTVVWTERTAKAFYSAAMPLLDVGDKVGARMAFKGAYDAISGGEKFIVSIGKDCELANNTISQAVVDEKLTIEYALKLALQLTDEALRHAVKTNQLTWGEAGHMRGKIDDGKNLKKLELKLKGLSQ